MNLLIHYSAPSIKYLVQKMGSKQKNLYLHKKNVKKHLIKNLIQTIMIVKSIKNNLLFLTQVFQSIQVTAQSNQVIRVNQAKMKRIF